MWSWSRWVGAHRKPSLKHSVLLMIENCRPSLRHSDPVLINNLEQIEALSPSQLRKLEQSFITWNNYGEFLLFQSWELARRWITNVVDPKTYDLNHSPMLEGRYSRKVFPDGKQSPNPLQGEDGWRTEGDLKWKSNCNSGIYPRG